MHPFFQQDDPANTNLFPQTWLATEPLPGIISTAPTGISLLGTVRDSIGQITDFMYLMTNSMQRALIGLPNEDLLGQPLTTLSPDVVQTGLFDRLVQVVQTGQPAHYIEQYHLDGLTGRYNQLYLKSDDGVLVLTQDVTHHPLSAREQQQQEALLSAIRASAPVAEVRTMLIALISGQASY